MSSRLALCLAVPMLLSACHSAAVAPIPGPLPEALEWRTPEAPGVFLGVEGEENSGDSLDSLTFEPGVRIVRVVPNSPAAQAGLQGGDVVLSLDGREVDDPGALDALVARAGPDTELTLQVLRGDTVTEVPVVVARATSAGRAPRMLYRLDPARSRAGWATADDGVALVTSAPDGPLERAEVPVGAVVQRLDGQVVASDRELIRRLQALPPGTHVSLELRLPDGQHVTRRVRLHEQPTRVTRWGVPVLASYDAAADGSSAAFSFFDIWILQLFQYRRDRNERTWVLLELFGWELFPFSTGVGELAE